jgi:hypothetical protein
MLYFAYGSNMKTTQMRKRTYAAKSIGIAHLPGKKVVCNKKSVDGSGKANIIDDPNGEVWGVLYEITSDDIECLSRHEKSYKLVPIVVFNENEEPVESFTYISNVLTDDPRPFKVYKKLILDGAKEHGLPVSYINTLVKTIVAR